MIIAGLIAWWLAGTAGFIFWWTKDYDLCLTTCFGALAAGLLGPTAWFFGWLIHGDERPPHEKAPFVVMRRRGS